MQRTCRFVIYISVSTLLLTQTFYISSKNTNTMSACTDEETFSVKFKYDWNVDADLKKLKAGDLVETENRIFSPEFGPKNFAAFTFGLQITYNAHHGYGIEYKLYINSPCEVASSAYLKYKLILPQTESMPIELKNEFYHTLEEDIHEVTYSLLAEISLIKCEFKIKELIEDFASLRSSARFKDVTLVIGEKEFPAHKAILSARSSVFATMFANEKFVENQTNRVEIGDMNPEILEALLDFIYTSKVNLIRNELATQLLEAAHLYDIKSLPQICAALMADDLDIANAVKYLLISKTYDLTELREKAIGFINENAEYVTDGEDFIKHVKPDNVMMNELYANLVKKNSSSYKHNIVNSSAVIEDWGASTNDWIRDDY